MKPIDDDLAEIDTTPEEFARYKAESETASLMEPLRTMGIRIADVTLTFKGTKAHRELVLDSNQVTT